jgi:predicted RNA-binding Zn-ribbon protein involved in translation (DUF1610 family)
MEHAPDHEMLREFHGPPGTADWCPHCGWTVRCAQCRAFMDSF